MYQLIKKSILVGIAAVWIIFPTFIFAHNVIYDRDELMRPKYVREYAKGGLVYTSTQEEWDQYKYSGEIVIQYFEYVLTLPVAFIIYMPRAFESYPLETLSVWTIFLAISGLYYICNFKKYNEWE